MLRRSCCSGEERECVGACGGNDGLSAGDGTGDSRPSSAVAVKLCVNCPQYVCKLPAAAVNRPQYFASRSSAVPQHPRTRCAGTDPSAAETSNFGSSPLAAIIMARPADPTGRHPGPWGLPINREGRQQGRGGSEAQATRVRGPIRRGGAGRQDHLLQVGHYPILS
jgi:hypothetical protein